MTTEDFDADDMDGVYDEMENPDEGKIYDEGGCVVAEDPTDEQKNFYVANNPHDIEQKQKWDNIKKIRHKNNTHNSNDNVKEEEKVNNEKTADVNELATSVSDKDYAEFAIKTIKKTVKREDILVRQVFYTGLSMYTFDPINLGILAPTSEGKTYVVTQVIKYFPKQDVWNIGSMSTKVLVRQKGILVDSNNEPLESRIKELKREISKHEKDSEETRRLKEQLEALLENPKRLIDLRDKVLVFLEEPHHELWNLLKPILSHDLPEIEFPYVDKTSNDGIITKNVVVRGWPACIFCSARDESSWDIWPEIQSRFLITSPKMDKEKYFESNMLIAQRKGLPNLVQQYVIVSDKEMNIAKKCVSLLKEQIKNMYSRNNADFYKNNNAVWIPYFGILGESLESTKGADNRVANRIFSLLNMIPLAKEHLRPKLIYGKENLVVATLEDLSEVLYITQNISGLPTHKIQFYKEIFIPLYKSKTRPDVKVDKEEKRIAVTTSQLSEYYKRQTGKSLTSNNIKQTYLNELINNGYVDEEESELDRRSNIYFPLIEPPNVQKITNYISPDVMDNLLQYSRILLPSYCTKIPNNWLNLEILDLLKCPVYIHKFQLVDNSGNETCICRFIKEYEKKLNLNGFFSNIENNNSNSKIIRKIKFLDWLTNEEYKKLSSQPKLLQYNILVLLNSVLPRTHYEGQSSYS